MGATAGPASSVFPNLALRPEPAITFAVIRYCKVEAADGTANKLAVAHDLHVIRQLVNCSAAMPIQPFLFG
jgi:hypothetical protein